MKPITKAIKLALIGAASTLAPVSAWANDPCGGLPSHAELKAALEAATGNPPSGNGGFNLEMWGTIVNRDGVVCAVAFTGAKRGDQWPGSQWTPRWPTVGLDTWGAAHPNTVNRLTRWSASSLAALTCLAAAWRSIMEASSAGSA